MSHERLTRTLAVPFDPAPRPRVDIEAERGCWVEVSPGRKVLVPGASARTATEVARLTRKRDSKRFGSVFTGCTMRQKDEFNRRFGHLGVKYVPNGETGTCKPEYEDIRAQRRVNKARDCHLMDDICG